MWLRAVSRLQPSLDRYRASGRASFIVGGELGDDCARLRVPRLEATDECELRTGGDEVVARISDTIVGVAAQVVGQETHALLEREQPARKREVRNLGRCDQIARALEKPSASERSIAGSAATRERSSSSSAAAHDAVRTMSPKSHGQNPRHRRLEVEHAYRAAGGIEEQIV